MLIIYPRATPIPNIWARCLKELDLDIAQLIETPYSGGFRYLVGVGILRWMFLGVVGKTFLLGDRLPCYTPSDAHSPNIWAPDLEDLDYDIAHLIETANAGGFR